MDRSARSLSSFLILSLGPGTKRSEFSGPPRRTDRTFVRGGRILVSVDGHGGDLDA
jgi:hypothetical protein